MEVREANSGDDTQQEASLIHCCCCSKNGSNLGAPVLSYSCTVFHAPKRVSPCATREYRTDGWERGVVLTLLP